jgi:hypothetical protein
VHVINRRVTPRIPIFSIKWSGQLHFPAALMGEGGQPLLPCVQDARWNPEQALMLWRREEMSDPFGNRVTNCVSSWPYHVYCTDRDVSVLYFTQQLYMYITLWDYPVMSVPNTRFPIKFYTRVFRACVISTFVIHLKTGRTKIHPEQQVCISAKQRHRWLVLNVCFCSYIRPVFANVQNILHNF